MIFPENLKYSKEHSWLLVSTASAKVGITDFAQSELGEIVYVDLPRVGQSFKQNEVFGSVEAIKTVSDLFMPVAGEVVEINLRLKDEPALITNSPFDDGWMLVIRISDPNEVKTLQAAAEYKKVTGN